MAGSIVAPIKLELPSKPVQELIKNIDDHEHIPERYIDRIENRDVNSEVSYMETNIIDLELLSAASSSPEGQIEMEKFRSIITSWGCFQLTNHGLSSLMNQVQEMAKQFFALPSEQKQKYSRTNDAVQGYGSDNASKAISTNWNDRLHLQVNPVDKRNLKFWPEDVPHFKEILDKYVIEIKKVYARILKAIATSLNLEETIFVKLCGEDPTMIGRFNYYPPCPFPTRVLGLGRHSDAGLFTILLQDKEVEGLQVLKDNQWFKVPIIPDALFVTIADQMEIMSNGKVKSSEHKVVVNSERERLSVAMSCSPGYDREIGPLSELIDDKRPPLYKNVTNYRIFFVESVALGVRPLDAVKI